MRNIGVIFLSDIVGYSKLRGHLYDFWTFSDPLNYASEVLKNRCVSDAFKTL